MRSGGWFNRSPDPVAKAATAHIHSNLRNMSSRVENFLSAPAGVQRQVLAQLEVESERRETGASSQALSTLVTVLATTITIFVALYAALVGGLFTTLAPLVDPLTGQIHGVDPVKAFAPFGGLVTTISLSIGAVIGIALGGWALARVQDRERAVHRAWMRVYREAIVKSEATATQARVTGWRRLFRKPLAPTKTPQLQSSRTMQRY